MSYRIGSDEWHKGGIDAWARGIKTAQDLSDKLGFSIAFQVNKNNSVTYLIHEEFAGEILK